MITLKFKFTKTNEISCSLRSLRKRLVTEVTTNLEHEATATRRKRCDLAGKLNISFIEFSVTKAFVRLIEDFYDHVRMKHCDWCYFLGHHLINSEDIYVLSTGDNAFLLWVSCSIA